MKARTSTIGTLALGLLLSASPALASEYPLENVLPKEAAEALAKQGIETTNKLLDAAAKGKARHALAKATGIEIKQLTTWVEMCDLMRIKGVGPEMSKLLRAAKVKTIKKLKRRHAKRLHKRLLAVNDKQKISQNPPDVSQLENWIAQAKKLKVVLR